MMGGEGVAKYGVKPYLPASPVHAAVKSGLTPYRSARGEHRVPFDETHPPASPRPARLPRLALRAGGGLRAVPAAYGRGVRSSRGHGGGGRRRRPHHHLERQRRRGRVDLGLSPGHDRERLDHPRRLHRGPGPGRSHHRAQRPHRDAEPGGEQPHRRGSLGPHARAGRV